MSVCQRKTLFWLVGLVGAYALVGFFILPPILRSLLIKQASQQLARPVSIEKVQLNPFTLAAEVRQLEVRDKDGEKLASWASLRVNLQASSLFRGGWVFHELVLDSLYFRCQMQPDGSFTFADLLVSTNPPATTPPEPFRLRVGHLQVTNAQIQFVDLTHAVPFTNTLTPVRLELNELDTSPGAANPYRFAVHTVPGEAILVQGQASLYPFRSTGQVQVAGVELPFYAPYYQDQVQFSLTGGTLETQLSYQLELSGDNDHLQLTNVALQLKGLAIAEKDSLTNTIEVAETTLNGSWLDLFGQIIHIGQFQSRGGQVHARRTGTTLNLAELFTPIPTPAENAPVPSAPATNSWGIAIDTLGFRDYRFRFDDLTLARPVGVDATLRSLEVHDLSTEPASPSPLAAVFELNTNGTLNIGGTLALVPLSAALDLALTNLSLQPFDRYLDDLLEVIITDGQLNLNGHAELSVDGPLAVAYRGDLALSNFVAATTSGRLENDAATPLAQFSSLRLGDLRLSTPGSPGISLKTLELERPVIWFSRDRTNHNWAGLLKSPAPALKASTTEQPPPSTAPASAEPGAGFHIDSLTISNGQVHFSDRSNERPVDLILQELGLAFTHVSNQPGTNMSVAMSTQLNTNGSFQARGSVDLESVAAQLQLDLKGIPLPALEPYLEPFLNLQITNGTLDLNGQLAAALPTNGPTTFHGTIQLSDFASIQPALKSELVRWSQLRLEELKFQLDPMSISAREIGWSDLALKLVMSGATNNLVPVVKTPPPEPQPSPAAATLAPKIQIDRLSLTNASFAVTDQGLSPPVQVAVHQLSGSVDQLSTETTQAGQVNLTGKTGRSAPFSITGALNALSANPSADLEVLFQGVELTDFSPYSAKFLGHQLNEGRLDVDVKVALHDRKVVSENLLVLKKLTLGEAVSSPEAVNAPVKLAVGLLKDPRGQIKLDVPVQGDLDDPEFRYGPVIWNAVVNLLLKAATSPFALLGRVVGGQDESEELSFVSFAPGSAELIETNNLTQLAQALAARPTLSLEIAGTFQPTTDGLAFQRIKAYDSIRKSLASSPAMDAPSFTLANYTNLVVQAYLNSVNAQSEPPTTVPSPTPPPRRTQPGFLKGAERLVRMKNRQPADPGPTLGESVTDTQPAPATEASTVLPPFVTIEEQFIAGIEVSATELNELAVQRAQQVSNYLTQAGIDPSRLSLLDPTSATTPSPRVIFSLR